MKFLIPGLLIVLAITIVSVTYQNTHSYSPQTRVVVVDRPVDRPVSISVRPPPQTPGSVSAPVTSTPPVTPASYTPQQSVEYRLSGPYTHANLSVYLVHSANTLKARLLTLQEAMEQGKVVVRETGNVNELTIENLSKDEEIFVQSGDIVKGGRQDRVMANDFIVPRASGALPISSFCVEHGRWSRRGQEESTKFASSTEQSSAKAMKIATKKYAEQTQVWNSVAESQEKLGRSLARDVKAPESASSYQLTLENKAVKDTVDDYTKSLAAIVNGKDDVIGFVFAINGKLNDADIYASHELFVKLWPKLLKSATVEAIAEFENGHFDRIPDKDVREFLKSPEAAPSKEKTVTDRVKVVTKENEKDILFDTFDNEHKESSIHKSYIRK